jgi:Ca2+-binding RTX toxin-like protein
MGGRGRRLGAAFAVALLASTVLVQVVPDVEEAHAADACASAFIGALDGPSDSVQAWTKGLATVGKLAEGLPGVGTSAGSVLGFPDLLHQWFNNGTNKLADALSCSNLNIDQDIDLGGTDGRSGHLTSTVTDVAGGKRLDVTVTAARSVGDQPLTVNVPIGGGSNAPQSAFSSQGGVDLGVNATLTFSLVREDAAPTDVYVVADSATPSLNVGATAHFASLDDVKAAIGILGVSVKTGSTLDVEAHFKATVNDPNNDGKLTFGSGGELSQSGSLEGLVNFGFASPAGHLNAHLVLGAAPSGSPLPIPLPPINATIDVSWPDISVGSPVVTPTGIDAAGKFLNMTPRDLAEGIAQLVTSLTSIQRANIMNFDLPFVKGTLADAVQLNEALKKFLADNTISEAVDPAQAGHPTFVSLQEFLDRLNTAASLPGGATIGVNDVHYDDSSSKLDFKITLHRSAPATGQDLNPLAAATSGGPGTTFTQTSLVAPGSKFVDPTTGETLDLAGQRVVAGAAGATIVSNTATTLTLQAPGWAPATPAAGSPYSISGIGGNVGVVELGNDLKQSGKGISEANGVTATAKVKPSYDASVTLVLDLRNPTLHDPPLVQNNPDGTTTLVEATPTGANRVLLRTTGGPSLFTADFPIDAGIDVFANAGFVQVRLQGSLKVCKTNPSADCSQAGDPDRHMIEVSLKDNGDMTFGQVVQKLLNAPGDLLGFDVNVAGAGSATVSVPDAPSFFSSTASASFHWDDVTDGGTPGPQFDLSGLQKLVNVDFDPSNPKQLFAIILRTLQTLNEQLGDANAGGVSIFSQKIPVVGRSLRDLLRADESGFGANVTYGANFVQDAGRSAGNGNAFPQSLKGRSIVAGTQVGIVGTVADNKLTLVSNWSATPTAGTPYTMRSELDDVISILQASPSDNLQELVRLLNARLGGSVPVSFAYQDDAKVGNAPSLVIKLDWQRSFHTTAPVQFDFDLPGLSGNKLVGAQGKGLLSLGAGGEIKIGLVVPLAPGDGPLTASALKILDDSSIGVKLDASVTGASIETTIGPIGLALGQPDGSDKATAKASYSLDLAKSGGDGTATDFGSFLGAVGPTVNAASSGVTCNLADETGSSMALCAKLPLYVKTGSNWSKLIPPDAHPSCDPNCTNDFAVRLPKSTSPVADYFDLTSANQVDGHPRLETPSADALKAAILSHLIDLTRLDGIDGFLDLLIQSLNAASFGGKLPLVGKDLQQGADFIGKLKASIDAALGDLASVNSVSGLRDWVNDKLAQGLDDAGLNPDLVRVDTQCSSALASPAVDSVTPNPAGGTHTFTYAIVGYVTDSSNNKHDAQPGTAGSTSVADFTTIDASHTNQVQWTAVTGAAGYKVYRQDGGQLKFLKDVGTATSYTDNGSDAAGAAPTNPGGPNPKLTNCSFSDFESVLVRLDVSQGDFSGDYLNCDGLPAGHECLEKTVPLDIGIPGLSLRAATPGDGPSVQIGWRLHLAFGVSRNDGFFFDTKDGDPQPELAVGLNFALPSEMNAQLAFINISAKNCTNDQTIDCDASAPAPGAVPPAFGGSFKIDITSPSSDGRLRLSDLSDASLDNLFAVKLTAGVHIDWLLKARPGADGPIAGFPGVQAELQLGWQWQNSPVGANNSNGGNQPLSIAFKKVAIDAGEIFSGMIGPVVNQIKFVTGPLDPVIKTLYAPIPVLSDLSHLVGGDDVTIVSIAKSFSTIAGGPDLTFVDTIAAVVNFINNIPDCTTTCLIPIGSFTLSGANALSFSATPANTNTLISSKTDKNGGSAFPSALGDLDGKNSKSGAVKLDDPGGAAKAGFSFPVFENPSSIFNLILGGDVDLVKFDSGKLALGFDWRQEFGPVYAPPPVMITLHGSAEVSLRIVAGFDTYGIRKAFEKVRDSNGDITFDDIGDVFLQSLFFYTTENGKPLPVVSFRGEIAAGAAVSAVIIKVGIEGGVALTISFLWNDPNHDGKFRISEFLQAALNNPICLFSVSGQISVFLRAYITIGFSPFSVSFSFTIVDVTLLDFSAAPDCSPPPPKLGGLTEDGTTLIVYAGALAHGSTKLRGAGDTYNSDNQEKDTVKITSLHDYPDGGAPTFRGIAVEMLGIRREFLNTNIQRVMVLGSGPGVTAYAKPMNVTFLGDGKEDTAKGGGKPPTANFDKAAIVIGGNAVDKIKTGIGDSFVDGAGGDDVISTSDRTVLNESQTAYVLPNAKAIVAGGPGSDSITVGNGDDTVAGDSALNFGSPSTKSVKLKELGSVESGNPGVDGPTVTVPNWENLTDPAARPSSSSVGAAGEDTINVGLGASRIYGNGGNDVLGVGADNALAKSKCSAPPASCIFRSAGVTIVGGTGSDNIAGGTGDDTIYTGPEQVTPTDGTGGNDAGSTNVVDTGTGNDTVYGGTGEDRVTGHSQPNQHDEIRGGSGGDILVGGYGTDRIFGGPGDDYVIAEPSNVDIPGSPPNLGFGPEYKVTHIPLPTGVSPAFKTLVGGTGNDHIFGGDGGANIDGDGFNETVRCGPGTPVASDPVDESVNTVSDGNDWIIGGAGVDNVRAGGGNDYADVKANNDKSCGESGNDTLKAGTGDDQTWGGSGNDIVYGDAGADHLFGNGGADTVFGGDGNDVIEGNTGTDWLSGGNANDVVVGGTRAPGRADQGDWVFGDTGEDVLIGDNGQVGNSDGKNPSGVTIYDLTSGNSSFGGADIVFGGNADDQAFGGLDDDWMFGGAGDDYIEGNNGADHLFGEADQDDIIGGSSQQVSGSGLGIIGVPDTGDTISGGNDQDVVIGDNGFISRPGAGNGSDFTQGRGMTERLVLIYDWANTDSTKYGDDDIHGDAANDVLLGEGGADTIHGDDGNDYVEGNQGADTVYGDAGQDDIIGGSSQVGNGATKTGLTVQGMKDTGDSLLSGGDGQDVILGDNGFILRTGTSPERVGTLEDTTKGHSGMFLRRINLYDVQDSPPAGTSGDDYVTGDDGDDVAFGQGGNDRIKGGEGDDHLEGGQGTDFVEGDAGDDDIVGGTSVALSGSGDAAQGLLDGADVLFGGNGDDLIAGDNASLLRIGPASDGPDPDFTTKFTSRLKADGTDVVTTRWFRRLDLRWSGSLLAAPSRAVFGGDRVSGGKGVDMLFGQDGNDYLSGGPDDDYAEGNGGNDVIRGDMRLDAAGPTNVFPPVYPSTADQVVEETTTPPALGVTWPGAPGSDLELYGPAGPDGQDDLIGGSSLQGFRDGNDRIQGDGESDFELGDNGALVRHYGGPDGGGIRHYVLFTKRYPAGAVPANATIVRYGDASLGMASTRFCTTAQATCEPTGAFGNDTMYGDAGADTMWGQDGADLMRGGAGDDDMYGELGNDTMYGDTGQDAMLGDRGGIVDTYVNGNCVDDACPTFQSFTVSQNQPPAVSYTGFVPGTYDRRVDLYHDVNGDQFVGSSTSPKMPHNGVEEGGDDHIRGGGGHDTIHGGFGDDVLQGDSGGDTVFGDRGGDVLWGGKGCDNGSADSADHDAACDSSQSTLRGENDRFVDYLFGGKGGMSNASLKGDAGASILDWQPRGSYPNDCSPDPWPQTLTKGKGKNATEVTVDPCDWFLMTNTYNDTGPDYLNPAHGHADNQTHHGIDWMYGGWDRDVLQADMAGEGPNDGDRLIDWNGSYNLFSHCNPSYGGFNDVRQLSPAMLTFLQQWGYGIGLGQQASDLTTEGTSAYEELAIVYTPDIGAHGSGPAFPTTPGHFESPNACTY